MDRFLSYGWTMEPTNSVLACGLSEELEELRVFCLSWSVITLHAGYTEDHAQRVFLDILCYYIYIYVIM